MMRALPSIVILAAFCSSAVSASVTTTTTSGRDGAKTVVAIEEPKDDSTSLHPNTLRGLGRTRCDGDVFTEDCCERANLNGSCRRIHEGSECRGCTCLGGAWDCGNPETEYVPLCGFETTGACQHDGEQCIHKSQCSTWDGNSCVQGTLLKTPCLCARSEWTCDGETMCRSCECQRLTAHQGTFCENENQVCRDEATDTQDCTCTNGAWSCTLALLDCDASVSPSASCDVAGGQCILSSGHCPTWDEDSGTCVDGTAWEQVCTCTDNGFGSSWTCSFSAVCTPCPPWNTP